MNLAALLRELYPPQGCAACTSRCSRSGCTRRPARCSQMQCPTPEQLLMGYEVIGVADVYGMPELLYAERQGLPPLPAWARGEGGTIFA